MLLLAARVCVLLLAVVQERPTVPAPLRGAAALLERARTELAAGTSAAARETLAQAVEQLIDRKEPEANDLLFELALLADDAGAIEIALRAGTRTLEVRERGLPPDDLDLQAARINLACTLESLGEFERARDLEQQALTVYERTLPDGHPDLQAARQNLGVNHAVRGEIPAARELFDRVLASAVRTLPAEHLDLQNARANVAGACYVLGELPRARALFEDVVAVLARTLPEDHVDLWRARENLALVLRAQGDLRASRVLGEQVLALRLRTLPADHPEVQSARHNLAGTLLTMDEPAPARELEQQVLEAYRRTRGEEHLDLQSARQNLAEALSALGEVQAARELEQQVLDARERALPPSHPDVQMARANLGVTLLRLGRRSEARALLERVLEVCAASLPSTHPDLASARANLASALCAADASAAERERFTSLALDFARGRMAAAREVLVSGSTREAEETCGRMARDVGRALSFAEGLGVLPPEQRLLRAAFELSETTRAAGLVAPRLAALGRGDPRAGELRARHQSARAELVTLAREGVPRERWEAALQRRDAAERDLAALAHERGVAAQAIDAGELAARLGQGSVLVALRRYTRTSVAAETRPASEASGFCALVLRGGPEVQLTRVELGTAARVCGAVHAWREALGTTAGRGRAARDARAPAAEALARATEELRTLLLVPLLPELSGAARVVILPDDALWLLPFDALPCEAPGAKGAPALLGERFEVRVCAALDELRAGAGAPGTASLLVALGAAAFDEAPDAAAEPPPAAGAAAPTPRPLPRTLAEAERFEALAATGPEAREIADLHLRSGGAGAEALVLLGQAATRDALAESAPRARWLHVATHGWFAPEQFRSWTDLELRSGLATAPGREDSVGGASPLLLCGLALAGANLAPDALGRQPGRVTAEELAAWDLSRCELAVLSACETSAGEPGRAGQGVASLQRALHMAGARSVIASLWKVPDEATHELMTDFYRRLWVEKVPKWKALQEAKRALRDAKDERGDPKYALRDWAAWVLTGEPD